MVNEWVREVRFPDYRFHVVRDVDGLCYVLAQYEEKDTVTGLVETQTTRRWLLMPDTTKSQFIATCFKCVLTSMEHRTREWFTYKNRAIYQPHYDVDALHAICEDRNSAAVPALPDPIFSPKENQE